MDTLTKEQRSWNMSRIRGRDTAIEVRLRSALHRLGFRFRKNVRGLPGTPDIVLPKYRTVVFVHGCFWHRHANCKRATMPKSRVAFWRKKFERNIVNDRQHLRDLRKAGWRVVTVWECQILKNLDTVAERIRKRLSERV